MSRLRARRESFFASRKGFIQKKPVSLNVPLYLPKKTIVRASFGSRRLNPGIKSMEIRIPKSPAVTVKPLGRAMRKNEAILTPSNKAIINSMAKPFILKPVKRVSFVSISRDFSDIILISQIYHYYFSINNGKGRYSYMY